MKDWSMLRGREKDFFEQKQTEISHQKQSIQQAKNNGDMQKLVFGIRVKARLLCSVASFKQRLDQGCQVEESFGQQARGTWKTGLTSFINQLPLQLILTALVMSTPQIA